MGIPENVRITDFNGKKHIKLRPASPKFRALLSIDGGGVRGIIPAVVMGGFVRAAKEVLRESYPECAGLSDDDMIVEVKDCFDTIAGNSAGSILALYFASGGGRRDLYDKGGRLEGHYPGSTEAIEELFDQVVKTIFKLPFMHPGRIPLVKKFNGVFSSMYGNRGLEEGLTEIFGDVTLKELLVNTYIPAYEVTNSRPVAFYCRRRSSGIMEPGYSSPKSPSHEFLPGAAKEEAGAIEEEAGAIEEEAGTIKEEAGTIKEETGTIKEEAGDVQDGEPSSLPSSGPGDKKDVVPGKGLTKARSLAVGVFPRHFDNSKLNIPVRIVAQASASAPIYFSSTTVVQKDVGIDLVEDSDSVSWVDGGVVSNNPTMQALAFMASNFYDRNTGATFPMHKMAVLSVGTGTAKSKKCSTMTQGKDGLVWWMFSLFEILMDSHCEINHAIVDALFDGSVFGHSDAASDRYVRINRIAHPGDEDHDILGALDSVDKISELKKLGNNLVEENWDTMKNFIKNMLMEEEPPVKKEQENPAEKKKRGWRRQK